MVVLVLVLMPEHSVLQGPGRSLTDGLAVAHPADSLSEPGAASNSRADGWASVTGKNGS